MTAKLANSLSLIFQSKFFCILKAIKKNCYLTQQRSLIPEQMTLMKCSFLVNKNTNETSIVTLLCYLLWLKSLYGRLQIMSLISGIL